MKTLEPTSDQGNGGSEIRGKYENTWENVDPYGDEGRKEDTT